MIKITWVSDLNDQPDSLLSSVTTFMAELKANSARLVIFCTEDSQYNRNIRNRNIDKVDLDLDYS